MINGQEYEAVMARHGVLQTFPVHQVLKSVFLFFDFWIYSLVNCLKHIITIKSGPPSDRPTSWEPLFRFSETGLASLLPLIQFQFQFALILT